MKKNDQLVWRPPGADWPVYILVTRVARDGSWADIKCYTWAAHWRKRQALPLPKFTFSDKWTKADLDRDAERALAGGGPE